MIHERAPINVRAILKPPSIIKAKGMPRRCIDVHAHFFNASDVPVKGYLEGPVAHDMPDILRHLVRTLAPIAEAIAEAALSAKDEFDELIGMTKQPKLLGSVDLAAEMKQIFSKIQNDQFQTMYDVLKNSEFEKEFNSQRRLDASRSASISATSAATDLSVDTIRDAVEKRFPSTPARRVQMMLRKEAAAGDPKEGILAFVYYMLSRRWMNLQAYAEAFSTSENSFGIDMVFGALVDFDRWLDCPPRSSHDDQVKLHQLLSQLSGGYMRPLVAYNPWTEIATPGKAWERVKDAVEKRGFVGAKIYPPMGFRPFGNTTQPLILSRPHPTAEDLDRVLGEFWDKCTDLDIPVMAHAGESMGWDDNYDELGGPLGWEKLLDRYKGKAKGPIINAGHFGGDSAERNLTWPEDLARLMGRAEGKRFYGDLGYWADLRCREADSSLCVGAMDRLKAALRIPLSSAETIADRIMFGTDWLMLSKENDWPDYPADIATALRGSLGESVDAFFGENAARCFARI